MKKVSIFLSLVCIMLAGCNSGEKVPALTGISLNKSELTLDLDETYRLRVLFEPEEAETEALVVKWESTKPKVATVDDSGKVTAVSEGKTTIIATCGKFSAECDVTVEKYIVPELEVSPLSIITSEAGGKYTIDVVSRRGWTVKSNADWVILNTEGEIGSKKVEVTIAPNETFEATEAEITFKTDTAKAIVSVRRAGRTAESLSFNPSTLEFGAAGGVEKVKVLCKIAWSVTVDPESGVTVNPSEGEGDTEIQISMTPNESIEKKEVRLMFTNGHKSEALIVTQAGRAPLPIILSPNKINAPIEGGVFTVVVTSALDWTVENNASWITTDNINPTSVDFIVAANDNSALERSAEVVFSNGESNDTLVITQDKLYITADVDLVEFGSQGGKKQITITSNVSWMLHDSPEGGFSINPADGEAGTTVVTMTALKATTTDMTTGNFVLSNGDVKCTIKVTRKGYVPGAFSVSSTKQVFFAKGNLQYVASTNTWRFAQNQYDAKGMGNNSISATCKVAIDLFGYGTSGYQYMPYLSSTEYSDYITTSIAGTNHDWGVYNNAALGGSTPTWRTPTFYEIDYLVSQRTDHDKLLGKATVADVDGYILLPDVWEAPSGITFTPLPNKWTVNVYTAEQWKKMEAAGAVFLPVTGSRYGTNWPEYTYDYGYYWTSSNVSSSSKNAYAFSFNSSFTTLSQSDHAVYFGYAVRLVKDVE